MIYSALIAVLLPAFHFLLVALPGVPAGSDSLALRLAEAAFALSLAALLIVFPRARRYAVTVQFVNVLGAILTIVVLVVNSGNHYGYIASGFLVVVGAQQAFYRVPDLAITLSIAFATEIAYSALHGILMTPMNLAALATFGSGYLISFVPAVLRIRIQDSEIWNRLDAQSVKEELEQAQLTLVQLARYDALTGLPNRTTVQELLTAEIARAERDETRCAVAFIDLDRFKDINDTLGHDVGDQLLRDVSSRVSAILGDRGVIGRWGGDEFIAIVPDVRDVVMVAELAQRFVLAVAEPFPADDLEFAITASVGIALFPADGSDAAVLIRNADTAMYTAKQDLGSGFAFFSDALHVAASTRHHVRNALRKAITDGELQLHYQPIVDAGTGRIVAAEALVRWVDGNGRLRMPSEFIAIAEDSRIILPLGAWVLNAACAQAARWHAAGHRLGIAVNVSPRQFAHPDFTGTLGAALYASGADPGRIEIEITEAAIMSNVEPVLATLKAVHRMGIRVAIDDFGTGYSSFAYLKRFEVDSLKIDRTFVEEIEREDNLAIARSIISVAHTLGLPVTAEGVENPTQAAVLAHLGCDRLQGYHFGRPVTAAEFETHLTELAAV
jgi:diguanylate cyclase (GGDEF)-like protein